MNNKFMTQINKRVTAMVLALMMVISMLPVSGLNVSADEVITIKADNFTEGVYVIEKGGSYKVDAGLSGTIQINTTEKVTVIGNGAEWDENYNMTSTANTELYFDCTNQEGVNLNLSNMYITNSSSVSGVDGSSFGIVGVKGNDNVLNFEGINVLEYQIGGGSNPSAIHVKQSNGLTIGGTGTLYFYKSAQGAGFGGSSGELNGDITFKDLTMFAKGTKQGALIGAGSSSANAAGEPGAITFESGDYNLITNSRGAAIGGSAGSTGGSSGTKVYVNGGTINVNVDYSGAAIGGGGYAEGNDSSGGTVYITGGSLRIYTDSNAAKNTSGYMGEAFVAGLVNDAPMTAERKNADDENVYRCVVDTKDVEANAEGAAYVVKVDDEEFYAGGLHKYGYVQEGLDKEEQLQISSTPSNWYKNGKTNLYLYLTGENHTITVNGVSYEYDWDAETSTFGLHKAEYDWYNNHVEGTAYEINTAAELAVLAELVNSGITFVGETIELGADIDLEGYDWNAIGGAAENVSLTVTNQEELQAAIDEHLIIYDDYNNSYKTGPADNLPYTEGYSYYYVDGAIFSGIFDGKNYTISNMTVNTDTGYAGLFGNVNGTIKNLTVAGEVTSTVQNGDYVGGVTGLLSEGGMISNVVSNVTVTAEKCFNVGGIAGYVGVRTSTSSADNTFVIGCVNNGTIVGYSQVGGIAGENAGQIIGCANNGDINGKKDGSKNGCAGIAGRNGCNGTANNKGIIINCYNTGNIGNSSLKWVGGIAGFANANTVIENCYNTGKVYGAGQTNAIVGQNEANGTAAGVSNCYYLDTTKGFDESGVYGGNQENCGPKTDAEMKTDEFVALLGTAFAKDTENENNGYPILARTISATETMKANAVAELDAYMKEESLYREKEAAVVKEAYDNAKNAIETAETLEDINVALVAAKTVIDETKTDAQLTEEETAVIEAFAAIIALEDPTAEDKAQVDAAKAAYEALDYPENVTNYDEFVLIENLVNALASGDEAAIAKAYAAIAKAEAAKSKEEAENAKAEADKSKAEAENAKVEADKAKAEAEAAKAEAEAAKKEAEEAKAAAEANKANEELLAKAEAAIKAAEEAKAVAEAYAKAAAMTKTSVADLTVEAVSTKEIKATWKSVDGADAYTVVVKRNNKVVATETVTDTTYTYTAGKAGYAYTVEVAPSLTYNDKVYEGEEVAATAITKPSRPGITVKKTSKKVTVKSKKQACTGYQIQISKSKKFKTVYKKYTVKKTSLTKAIKLSALKSGKSYIRIRAYKTYNGKTVYSKWSKVKTVKR